MKADTAQDRTAYWCSRDWLTHAVHELPAGVLDGPHGASSSECQEMLQVLADFEQLCDRLGIEDHRDFIEGCRWHFERYPHYLGRRRHFTDYATYIRERNGPLRVPGPPPPARWLTRQ